MYQNFDTKRFMIRIMYWGFQQHLQTQGLCIIIQIGDVTPKGNRLPSFGKKEKEQLWEEGWITHSKTDDPVLWNSFWKISFPSFSFHTALSLMEAPSSRVSQVKQTVDFQMPSPPGLPVKIEPVLWKKHPFFRLHHNLSIIRRAWRPVIDILFGWYF